MTIIAFTGRKGSGKDTCANYLIEKYGFQKRNFSTLLKDVVAHVYELPRDRLEGILPEDREWREQKNPLIQDHPMVWESKYLKVLNMVYPFAFDGTNSMSNYRQKYLEMGDKSPAMVLAELWDLLHSLNDLNNYDRVWSPREALQIIGTEVFRTIYQDTWLNAAFYNLPENVVISDLRFSNEGNKILQEGGVIYYVERDLELDANSVHSSENTEALIELCSGTLNNNGSIEDLYAKLGSLI